MECLTNAKVRIRVSSGENLMQRTCMYNTQREVWGWDGVVNSCCLPLVKTELNL